MGGAMRRDRPAPWVRCPRSVSPDTTEQCRRTFGHAGDHDVVGDVRPGLLMALRHPAIAKLGRIGPIFPGPDFPGATLRGMRGVPRKATKAPFRFGRRRVRRAPDAIKIHCEGCSFVATGRTWRPTRERLAEHVAKKHPKLARAG